MEDSHFLAMMRTVQPHVSGRPKRSVELMLQSADLMQAVKQYREPELSACDTGQDFIDFEGMLTDLQAVCNPAEAEIANLILNFFRSRKIYAAYRAAASQQNSQQSSQPNLQPQQTTQENFPRKDMAFMAAERQANSNSHSPETAALNETAPNPDNNSNNNPNSANNTFRSLMENQALQSLLSPAQKENLNQIGSFMQALS